MKKISLDSILLFAFVIPFVMTYSLNSGETPFLLFGLIFFGLVFYIILDFLSISQKTYFFLKQSILWLLIIGVIGSSFTAAIIERHKASPTYMVHDIIIQQEAAIRFMLQGINPYGTTYFGTPLEQWHYSDTETNPALYHFVMQPLYLIFALPFYKLSNILFGFFDARFPLLFLFMSIIVGSIFLIKDKLKRLLFIVVFAFNPAILGYTLEGRSDMFMFAFLFFGLFFLHKNKYTMSAVLFALSFTVKQSSWPFFPLYIAYLYIKTKDLKQTIKTLLIFLLTLSIIVGPFLFWNQKAFLDSTVFYLAGNALNSYPISGYGIGMVLNQFGIITDLKQYYPFIVWQIFISIPVLFVLILFLKKSPKVNRLIVSYGLFLFIFWYLSRYFNNSHLAFLSVVFITAYFWPDDTIDSKKYDR